jgi:hypothetical protein
MDGGHFVIACALDNAAMMELKFFAALSLNQ